MALPAVKKRKLFSLSEPDVNSSYAQPTLGDSFQDSSDEETEDDRGNAPSRSFPATPEGERNGTTSCRSGTYHSNIFALKANELLAKVRPDYEGRMANVENCLRKLKDLIERIPNREAKSVCTSASFLMWPVNRLTLAQLPEAEREQLDSHNVRIPFPQPRPAKEAKFALAYSKPANINVVGSYARRTAIQVGGVLRIDLAVTMPSVRPPSPGFGDSPFLIRTKAHISREGLSEL